MDRTQNENTIQYMKHTKYRLKPTVCVMSLFENIQCIYYLHPLFCPLILMNFLKFMLHMIFQLQRIRLHRLLFSIDAQKSPTTRRVPVSFGYGALQWCEDGREGQSPATDPRGPVQKSKTAYGSLLPLCMVKIGGRGLKWRFWFWSR